MTLKDTKPGDAVVVVKILGEKYDEIKRRIIEFGILPGTRMEVIKVAPFGDPIQVSLLEYDLIIRKSEAEKIVVDYEKS
ncbi:MAG: ferrous iron transport protein A [Clostridia bacterium]|jgi:ferrous iron transport protein A|nr:ferrous iron transport protein A [Clostridia bacterium]